MSNDQLQEARKKLLYVLPELTDSSVVGVKWMGEVNQQPFQDACLQKFSMEEAEMRAMELSSLWQIKVNNSNWHPFKKVFKDEKLQYLEENKNLILAMLEHQNQGKVAECNQLQVVLQKNLMNLAAIADAQPPPSGPSKVPPNSSAQQGNYMQPPQGAMTQQPPQGAMTQQQYGGAGISKALSANAPRSQDQ